MKNAKRLRILFVEDLPTDMMLAERKLRADGLDFEFERVDAESALTDALRDFKPDIVISDYAMPSFDGMTALKIVREFDAFLPFIVLTGSMNEEVAVACMKAGATDYVIKEHLSRLSYSVSESLERMRLLSTNALQETKLRQSEQRYRSIFEYCAAMMLIIDPATLAIVDANDAAIAYYGWPRESLLGKSIADINTQKIEIIRQQMRSAMESKKNFFQFRHRHADGAVSDVEVHANPIMIEEKSYLFTIMQDISQRLEARRQRDEVAAKLSHYLATSPTVTYAFHLAESDMRMDWISENIATLLGYSPEDALAPGWWFKNIAAEDRAAALRGVGELTKAKRFAHEYRFIKKDRTTAWLRDEMRLTRADAHEGSASEVDGEIVGTLTDITEKKRSEAEIRLKSTALEAAGDAIVITDRDGMIEWANLAFQNLTGYSIEEALGKNPRALIKSGSQDPTLYRQLWDTIISGKSWQGELTNRRKTGELYIEEMTITPVLNADGKIEHFIAIQRDISEKKRVLGLLELSLREKEALLREVHHRVKNNMQIITSLLNLSSEDIKDQEACRIVEELHRRVETMSMVHDQFYRAGDLSRIDFSLYLRQLAESLVQDIVSEKSAAQLRYRLEPVFLTLEAAIPAGLIVSELVSNALRFPIPPADSPLFINITLKRDDHGNVALEVRDNGQGYPEGFVAATSSSLGMRLILILASQLNGTVNFSNDRGALAALHFKQDS